MSSNDRRRTGTVVETEDPVAKELAKAKWRPPDHDFRTRHRFDRSVRRPSSPAKITIHDPSGPVRVGAVALTGKATGGWNAVDNTWNGIDDIYVQVDGGPRNEATWRRGPGDPLGQVTWSTTVQICSAGPRTVRATVDADTGSAHSEISIVASVNASVGPNVRVTIDGNPANDRSESSLAVDPLAATHIVGASKKFWSPPNYGFTIAAYASFDGGNTWSEAPAFQLQSTWGGISDPVVAIDRRGISYLVALPFVPGVAPNDVGTVVGIAVYSSPDGIQWGATNLIHQDPYDDKQAVASDNSSSSPHWGNVYAAWDSTNGLAFARKLKNGNSWIGVGAQPAGSPLGVGSFSPELAVAADGTLYIAFMGGQGITLVKSTDGGDSFTTPAPVATGITTLLKAAFDGLLQMPNGFPELPGGTFRVETMPAICAGIAGHVVVAWADYRDGVSRIYYRHSQDFGTTWLGPASGQQLLSGASVPAASLHDFNPQLASDPAGLIGCVFYEFGPTPVLNLINVVAAFSDSNGQAFPSVRTIVTDRPWDPTIDAPLSHGDPQTTFIGDYFGLAASGLGFFPFWTDTRTGVQEIFTAAVSVAPCHGIAPISAPRDRSARSALGSGADHRRRTRSGGRPSTEQR